MTTKETGLVRELGLTEAAAIGLGTMIGAGIFVLSAIAAESAGPAASISYLLAGLVVLPTALTISELATGMPEAGGSYHLISRVLGPLAGAVVGPGNWLGLTFATGFYLIGFAEYVAYFVPIPTWITALTAGLLFGFLNYRGSKVSGRIQNVIVIVLLLILGFFAIRAFFSIERSLHTPFAPSGWGVVVASVGLVIVSFTGFEKISTIAGEVKRPERTLPVAIIGSVIIATILYTSILYTSTGVISYRVIADFQAPLVEAARRFMSTFGVVAMSAAALLATASSANAAIMASSRINFAMGRDFLLPPWFSDIHAQYRTPYHSILVTTLLAILLALSGQAAILAEVSSALFMVSYALLALSLLVVRRVQPTWYLPSFRVPFFPFLPVIGGLLALAVITVMHTTAQIAGLGLIGLGVIWYLIWARHRTEVKGALLPWLERERPFEATIADIHERGEAVRSEILVPIANPASAHSLVTVAAALARGREEPDSRVVALKLVKVPMQLPAEAVRDYLQTQGAEHRASLDRAIEAGVEIGVPVDTLLRAAHDIASGILGVAANRPHTRLMLLGWHGPVTFDRITTSIDKALVNSAPTDVAVLLDRRLGSLEDIRRILLPAGGGPHARRGLRLAHDLAIGDGDASLTVLRVFQQGEELSIEEQKAGVDKLIYDELGANTPRVEARVVRASSIVSGILEEAEKGYDLIVIGASEQWFLPNWLFGAIPDRVAEQAPCSVLLVKKREPATLSRVRRLLKGIGPR